VHNGVFKFEYKEGQGLDYSYLDRNFELKFSAFDVYNASVNFLVTKTDDQADYGNIMAYMNNLQDDVYVKSIYGKMDKSLVINYFNTVFEQNFT
jgi:hypothetical protein